MLFRWNLWIVGGVLLGGSLFASANQKKPLPKKETRYQNRLLEYSFAPPKGWTRHTEMPAPMIGYLAPSESDFSANLIVSVHTQPVEAGHEAMFLASVKKEVAKTGTISDVKPIKVAGKMAYQWRTKLNKPDDTLENRQAVCFYHRRGYEITLTFLSSTRAKYDPIFEQVLNSFQFGK